MCVGCPKLTAEQLAAVAVRAAELERQGVKRPPSVTLQQIRAAAPAEIARFLDLDRND